MDQIRHSTKCLTEVGGDATDLAPDAARDTDLLAKTQTFLDDVSPELGRNFRTVVARDYATLECAHCGSEFSVLKRFAHQFELCEGCEAHEWEWTLDDEGDDWGAD